jgi:hypothetical protein
MLHRVEKNRKEDDTGEYWCVATSAQGTAVSNRAKLEIACEYAMQFVLLLYPPYNRKCTFPFIATYIFSNLQPLCQDSDV